MTHLIRIAVLAVVVVAGAALAAPVAADSGQWAGPGTERDYCAGLLEWGRQHPEVPEFDGWPEHCRTAYPDLVTPETTTTTTTVDPPAEVGSAATLVAPEPVATAPAFTG